MKPIRAVLFDLGGVLYEIDYARMQEAFRKLNPDLSISIFSPDTQVDITYPYEKGEISTQTFLSGLQNYFPGVMLEQLAEAWNCLLVGLYSHAIPILEILSRKYPLYLLSNINELHYTAALSDIEKIKPYFQECFFSCYIGHRKPEREAFQYVIDQIGFSPEEILFLDDSKQNIQVAREMGLQAVQMKGEELNAFFSGEGKEIGELVSLLK